jgi:CRISPR type III-A-associated RAMP protein Csm4
MADFKIFKLHFLAPLHLSKGKTDDYGESEEILHSDTIKSALYVSARQLFGANEIGNNESFFNSFQISSAFPFYEDELFFPKPMAKIQPFKNDEIKEELQAKKHKKVAYLGKSYFEDLINDQKLHLSKDDLTTDGKFISNHAAIKKLATSIFKSEVQQRVTIPADYSEDPTPYYVDRLFFAQGAGLWFAFKGNDETFEKVSKALNLLGDLGIGTDRSVGNGQFESSVSKMNLRVPENAKHQLSLSLWCPLKEEINDSFLKSSSYGLVKRGGYIASPAKMEHLTLRKKSIYMFTEGSIFPNHKVLKGKISNLKPDIAIVTQDVWRDGLAFMIPINKAEV